MRYTFLFFLVWLIFHMVSGQADSILSVAINEVRTSKKGERYISIDRIRTLIENKTYIPIAVTSDDGKRKIGFVNSKGKFFINPDYVSYGQIQCGIIPLQREGWNFYRIDKGMIGEEQYDSYRIISPDIILVSKNMKWGAILQNNKEKKIIEPKYKRIEFNDNKFKALKFNSWEILSGKDSVVKSLEYDSIDFFKQGYLIYSINNKKGLYKLSNKTFSTAAVTGLKFDNMETAVGHLIKVNINGRAGLIDYDGNEVVPATYDSIRIELSEENKNLKIGLYNEGSVTLKEVSSELTRKLIPVKVKVSESCELWGYADEKDSIIIDPGYSDVKKFIRDSALVYRDGRCGIINKSNQWLVEPENYELYKAGLYKRDSSGKATYFFSADKYMKIENVVPDLLKVKSNNFWGVSNHRGKLIIDTYYERIVPSIEDSIFVLYKGKKIGIIDFKGDTLLGLTDRFDKIFDFIEGRAKFIKQGKYGFVDARGNIRVAPQYTEVSDFKEGAAAVIINGKWGFIDKDENILVQPLYSEVGDFKNGIARVKQKNKWYFVDKKGNKINSSPYDQIIETENENWLLVNDKKQGLADVRGREMLAPRYEFLLDLNNGMVIVKKENKWGVVDSKENIVIPREYDYIIYSTEDNLYGLMKNGAEEVIEFNLQK
ncbi:MAG: WG repeat-containing protein [Cytophagaceae bacterium]|nr:WG repeat-containing protein [Cytophagaceae bacterium]